MYLRDLAAASTSAVPGTEGAIYAFFSPDGSSLGFLTDDRVKKVALDGTAPVTLGTANMPVNATWTPGGQIYVAEEESRRLSRVPASGGTLTTLLPSRSGIRFSQVLRGSAWRSPVIGAERGLRHRRDDLDRRRLCHHARRVRLRSALRSTWTPAVRPRRRPLRRRLRSRGRADHGRGRARGR